MMKIVYALETEPQQYTHSIFLAGLSPRDNNIISWRKNALSLLNKYGYNGVVYVPEHRNRFNQKDYYNQIDWELKMLDKSDIILFYVNRNIEKNNLELTTNIEYGRYENSGKIVLGFSENADSVQYMKEYFHKLGNTYYIGLENTIKALINKFKEDKFKPNLRKDSETDVPLYIWNTKEFQDWYKNQKSLGNKLLNAKINYVFIMPKMKKVFLWILQVAIFIKKENRIKDNEFVLSRTNICSALLYYKPKVSLSLNNGDYIEKIENNILDTSIVVVKEFRSPINNGTNYVYELPGGSSMIEEDNIDVIHNELIEECNLNINKGRINFYKERQLMATLSCHKSYLYYVELNKQELNMIKRLRGQSFGVEEDTEKTYVEVYTVRELLKSKLLDWSNIGMILEFLNKR